MTVSQTNFRMKSITSTSARTNRTSELLVSLGFRVIVFVLALSWFPTSGQAFDVRDIISWQFQPSHSGNEVAIAVAKQLIPALIKNDDAFAKRLGFLDANEALPNQLSVAVPYPVFIVSLKQLLAYDPQVQSPIVLLLGSTNFLRNPSPFPSRFLFPIKAPIGGTPNGPVRTSVLIHMPPNSFRWEVFRIGSPELITALTGHGSAPRYFVVSLPALNRYYLGTIDVGMQFKVKAVFHDPIGMNPGDERNAEQVFIPLKQEAVVASMDQGPR